MNCKAKADIGANILKRKVSYFSNAMSKNPAKDISILEALNEIRSNLHRDQVYELRTLLNQGNREHYNELKKQLPAITFCGTFNDHRKKENIKAYNHLFVFDIDKIKDDELKRVKLCLSLDPYVFAFWESPSGEGIKGLMAINYMFELNSTNTNAAHKGVSIKILAYLYERYQIKIDNSGKDITRLCFFSHDPRLELKNEFIAFDYGISEFLHEQVNYRGLKTNPQEKRENAYSRPNGRNNLRERLTMGSIISFLKKNNLSITNSYDEWYRVAEALSSTFTYEVGLKYFMQLSSMDDEKYDELKSEIFFRRCYNAMSGRITFRTIVYFAREKGFFMK